jgi:hypothetical protein
MALFYTVAGQILRNLYDNLICKIDNSKMRIWFRIKFMKKSLKFKSLQAFLILVLGLGLNGFMFHYEYIDELSSVVLGSIIMAIGFLYVMFLRCSICNKLLIKMFPWGSLILLFLARQKCKKCGEYLE